MQSIEDKGVLYVRTDPRTWKVKRIRCDPHVRIALCDRTGKPVGTWLEGDACVVEGVERSEALSAFRTEYGAVGNLLIGLVARLRKERLTTVVTIRLRPTPAGEGE